MMTIYTEKAWKAARVKLQNTVKSPITEVVVHLYGPPAVAKKHLTRDLEKAIKELGFDTLIRTEIPIEELPGNEIYGVKGFSIKDLVY